MDELKIPKSVILRRLDHYLLINHPTIWQSKILWVAFYSLTLFGLFYLLGDGLDYEPEPGSVAIYENGDYQMFYVFPRFLTVLMLLYWLRGQSRQKVDYSLLSAGGFLNITILNFLCVALMFLPALGLAYSAFDTGGNLIKMQTNVQSVLSFMTFMAVLPFVIRQYRLIEVTAAVFIWVMYCLTADILFSEGYLWGVLALTGFAIYKFARKTFTQNTKRVALLCLLVLPLVFHFILYYVGVYGSAYFADKEPMNGYMVPFLKVKWWLGSLAVLLVTYSVLVRLMYRAMQFPTSPVYRPKLSKTFKPAFLQKLDQYLLINHPFVWQTKILWVVFYSLSLFGLCYLLSGLFNHELAGNSVHDWGDPLMFKTIPWFLSMAMLFYWLYVQIRQKADYSQLSLKGFLGMTWLNFVCMGLIFLPAVGLAYATLDTAYDLKAALQNIQTTLTLLLPIAVFPFILRYFQVVETIIVIFAGILYCLCASWFFMMIFDSFGQKEDLGLMALFLNYWVFLGYVFYKFKHRVRESVIKWLAFLCTLALPFVIPGLLYYVGYYSSPAVAYDLLFGLRGNDTFGVSWIIFEVGLILTTYGVLAYFMYRAMATPVEKF